MPTPRYLALAIASTTLMVSPSAFADDNKAQNVTLEFEIESSPESTLENIEREAWRVCKPEATGVYASIRNRLRRDCQKKVVADVIDKLAQSDEIQFATQETADAH